MTNPSDAIRAVEAAFGGNAYPGDRWQLGSTEGEEPYEEVLPFQGRTDWRTIEPAFLDMHAGALSFFSEAGFRFFLPAYLIADLHGTLVHADPVFHLTHGLFDLEVRIPLEGRDVTRSIGRSALVNPLRYGAMTFFDYHRYRLSVFTREESAAVVAYLEAMRTRDDDRKEQISEALDAYWRERASHAPEAADLARHNEAMRMITGVPPEESSSGG